MKRPRVPGMTSFSKRPLWRAGYHGRLMLGDLAHRVMGLWTLSPMVAAASRVVDSRAPTTLYVAPDADRETLAGLAERASSSGGVAVVAVDLMSLGMAGSTDLVLEHVPSRAQVAALDDSIDYERFVARRLSHLADVYRPRAVSFVARDGTIESTYLSSLRDGAAGRGGGTADEGRGRPPRA